MWYFLAFAAVLVATYALAPKPQNQKPATLEEIDLPTAEEGSCISVLFGCRDIPAPFVAWYGDLRTVAIKSSGGKK